MCAERSEAHYPKNRKYVKLYYQNPPKKYTLHQTPFIHIEQRDEQR